MSEIRLGCMHCDRDDCDGIAKIPANWHDVEEVEPSECVLNWETHIGVCPDCYDSEALTLLKSAAKFLPLDFWVVECGCVLKRVAHGVTSTGFVSTIERWAGLREETVPFDKCYDTEEAARSAK